MGATRLTLRSCALTWARSAVLTNSACRSWVNGSSPVVRFLASPRLPQPHQLHRQIASGDRRVQAPTTPSIMKSRVSHARRPLAALQHVTASPSKIGDITRAALVLTHFEYGCIA